MDKGWVCEWCDFVAPEPLLVTYDKKTILISKECELHLYTHGCRTFKDVVTKVRGILK